MLLFCVCCLIRCLRRRVVVVGFSVFLLNWFLGILVLASVMGDWMIVIDLGLFLGN